MEWRVMEDEPLPEVGESNARTFSRRQWAMLATGMLLLLLVGAGLLRQRVVRQEARVRQDVTHAIIEEERVRRFGVEEQAREMADPRAPEEWWMRYAAYFRQPAESPEPEVRDVEYRDGVAIATLAYQEGPRAWERLQAYRLVGGRWRRTPVPDALWGETSAYHSQHFTLYLTDRDAVVLPPGELLTFLEEFRANFIARWPSAAEERLSLRVGAGDLRPVATGATGGERELQLTSPLVAAEQRFPFLDPPREYRLALAESLAAALDADWWTAGGAPIELEGTQLREELRTALVRHLVLSEEERRLFREWIRSEEARAGRRAGAASSLEQPDRGTTVFLLDYLTALRGTGAPGQLAVALRRSVSLSDATIQAFGLPLPALLREVRLWMERAETGVPPDGSERTASLLRVLESIPFRALVVRAEDGALVEVTAEDSTSLPLPPTCLGSGSRLTYQEAGEGEEAIITNLRVASLRLPAWPIRKAPEGTRVVVARPTGSSTRILALDEAGNEVELASLPGGIELVMHPREFTFAFLYHDQCGETVNQYIAELGEITRAPVSLEGRGHLFWGEQLFLVDDVSGASAPYWAFTPVRLWDTRERFIRPLRERITWGKVLGYSSAMGRYLLESGEGELFWLDMIRWFEHRGAVLRPAGLDVPHGATGMTLSREGRWLAYTHASENEPATLYALDIEAQNTLWLLQVGPGATVRDVSFGPGFPTPVLVSVAPPAGSNAPSQLLSYLGFPTNETMVRISSSTVEGVVDHLYWCNNGRALFRLERGDEELLAEEVIGAAARVWGEYGQVLGCLDVG